MSLWQYKKPASDQVFGPYSEQELNKWFGPNSRAETIKFGQTLKVWGRVAFLQGRHDWGLRAVHVAHEPEICRITLVLVFKV